MSDVHQIRLEVPSAAEYIGIIRHAVAGIADRMQFSPGDIDDLKLAVGEACNNAVKHGCPNSSHPFITVTCKVTPEMLEIEIRNKLSGGEPCPVPAPPPDGMKEGGMGLYIMHKVMDKVDIIWKNKTARIRMTKRLKPHAEF
ncbi:MAG: ATP-binding protein [Armatimonadota bacterium]